MPRQYCLSGHETPSINFSKANKIHCMMMLTQYSLVPRLRHPFRSLTWVGGHDHLGMRLLAQPPLATQPNEQCTHTPTHTHTHQAQGTVTIDIVLKITIKL